MALRQVRSEATEESQTPARELLDPSPAAQGDINV